MEIENKKIDSIDEFFKKKDLIKEIIGKSKNLVKSCQQIPSNQNVVMAKKSQKTKQNLQNLNEKFFGIMSRIGNIVNKDSQINMNKYASVIDINDEIFENIDLSLDKYKQNKKKENEVNIEQKSLIQNQKSQIQKKDRIQDIYFPSCIENSELPFIPKLPTKLNAVQPLEDLIISAQQQGMNFFKDIHDLENFTFPHPYQTEITELNYQDHQLNTDIVDVKEVGLITPENFLYVDNEENLQILVNELKLEKEIGIDLEHHGYRTFQGITCLIQISTRSKDYVVDPFPIWKQLHILNEVFTDPKIVKILHGADMDIQWLQRDFGIYIINMFDTGQAARQLSLPSYSLAYLLKHYCSIEADKKYQLADWRQRPLSKDMMFYARSDTHYLFKIYEQIRNDLINQAITKNIDPQQQLISVLKKSGEICLKKYQKPVLKDNNYHQILQRHRGYFNKNKLKILEDLLAWRFEKARQNDESLRFVMANDVLFQIVQQLPGSLNELFMKFRNLSKIVKDNAQQIIDIICNGYGEKSKEQKKTESLKILQQKMQQKQLLQQQKNTENDQVNMEEEFQKLQINKIEIIINQDYSQNLNLIQQSFKKNQDKTSQLQEIKNSFTYQEPIELYCEFHPKLQQIYNHIKEKEQEAIKNNLLIDENLEKTENETTTKNLQEPTRIEFIELPKQAEPSAQKEEVDIRFPDAIADQYNINIKRERAKKYKFAGMNDPSKKQQTHNAYSAFQESDNEDEQEQEEKIQQENNNNNSQNQNQQQQQKKQDNNKEKQQESDEDDNEDTIKKELSISMRMNEIADSVKESLGRRKTQNFMHLEDPIDQLYRETTGKKRNAGGKKRGGRGGNQGIKQQFNKRFVKKH